MSPDNAACTHDEPKPLREELTDLERALVRAVAHAIAVEVTREANMATVSDVAPADRPDQKKEPR